MIYHDLPVKNGDVDLFMLKYQRVSKKKNSRSHGQPHLHLPQLRAEDGGKPGNLGFGQL
jgi:hypothetical protein